MKRIDAVIRPHVLDDVVRRLRLVGVKGMTVAEVHGLSDHTANDGVFHGQRYRIASAPRYHLMIVVPEDLAASVVRAVAHAARTEEPGDGIVTVTDLAEAVRIRTGESGPDAV